MKISNTVYNIHKVKSPKETYDNLNVDRDKRDFSLNKIKNNKISKKNNNIRKFKNTNNISYSDKTTTDLLTTYNFGFFNKKNINNSNDIDSEIKILNKLQTNSNFRNFNFDERLRSHTCSRNRNESLELRSFISVNPSANINNKLEAQIETQDKFLDKDYKNLLSYYERGHLLGQSKFSENNKSEKQNIFRRYNIENKLIDKEKEQINEIIKKVKNSNTFALNEFPEIKVNYQYFKNPLNSLKKLKINRQLLGSMMNIRSVNQLNKYGEIFSKVCDENFKLSKMPEVKVKYINPYSKIENKFEEVVQEKKGEDLSLKMNFKNFTKHNLFENKIELTISFSGGVSNSPPSRIQSTLVKYCDSERKSNKFFLFGGINSTRLNDIWSCEIKDNYFQWKKLNLKGDSPMTRNGHTAVIHRTEMFIWGGVIEDEKSYRVKEDILIFDIVNQRFFRENCHNKRDLKWRKHHIAELIGGYMLIFGGIDEDSEHLNDLWVLNLVSLTWLQVEIKGLIIPPLAFHCSAVVLPKLKREDKSFNIFKIYNSFLNTKYSTKSKLKQEGVYIFGGINDEMNYSNDIYVIKLNKKPFDSILLKTNGVQPSPRSHSKINFYENINLLILHGGKNNNLYDGVTFNDFWVLDLENFNWYKLNTNDGVSKYNCPPRAEYCSLIHDHNLFIFGGCDNQQFLGSDFLIANLDIYDHKVC